MQHWSPTKPRFPHRSISVVMKVVGPQLLAKGNVEMFAKFARITVVCSFLLVPLILGSALPFTSGLAFSYGGNACGYAQNSECVAFFTNVFGANAEGGTYSLSFTFDVFPLGACVEAIFFVLRSILLTLVDLDYMVKCTVLAIIVYIPAIVVASVAEPFGGKAISYSPGGAVRHVSGTDPRGPWSDAGGRNGDVGRSPGEEFLELPHHSRDAAMKESCILHLLLNPFVIVGRCSICNASRCCVLRPMRKPERVDGSVILIRTVKMKYCMAKKV
jgi:hypothetical protein